MEAADQHAGTSQTAIPTPTRPPFQPQEQKFLGRPDGHHRHHAAPVSGLANSVVAAIAEQLNDPDLLSYIALAAAFFAYWFSKENGAAAGKEFTRMGIITYIRQIRDEVIDEAKAEAFAAAKAKGISEGRRRVLAELRAMPRHEALALLGFQDTDTDDPESPSHGNDQPPST